jgi:hypothetical protein
MMCQQCQRSPAIKSFLVRYGQLPQDPGNPRTPDKSSIHVVRLCGACFPPAVPLAGARIAGEP